MALSGCVESARRLRCVSDAVEWRGSGRENDSGCLCVDDPIHHAIRDSTANDRELWRVAAETSWCSVVSGATGCCCLLVVEDRSRWDRHDTSLSLLSVEFFLPLRLLLVEL